MSAGRKPTGSVVVGQSKAGTTFTIRFQAYGKRRTVRLGTAFDGWTRQKAEEELDNVLADVRRGTWQPPATYAVVAPPQEDEETFHEFASAWLYRKRQQGLAARTIEDYEWALSHHILPFFQHHRLSEITKREVDRFRDFKAAEGVLSPQITNKVLGRLAMVLEDAVDYDLIPSNPANGKKRRLKVKKGPERSWAKPQQLMSLLEAAEKLLKTRGRPLHATLAGTGLRIEEALSLRWYDVDLARGTLTVRESKTDAGIRVIRLRPALREELVLYRAEALFTEPDDYVFPTLQGGKDDRNNVRQRLILPAAKKVNERLTKLGIEPIGAISPHSLRRTNATLRALVGEQRKMAAKEMGHVSSRFTFDVYEQASDLCDWLNGPERAEFDRGVEWATWAQEGVEELSQAQALSPEEAKTTA